MRWRNHQIITGLAIYSITGGFISAGLAAVGAVLPDVLEVGGVIKHRTVTHWPYPYLLLASALYLWQWHNPSVLPYLLFFFVLGVVMHLLLDSLSNHGIPVGQSPSAGKRLSLNLYKTFTPSEEVTSAGLVVVFLATAYFRGLLSGEHIRLEVNLVVQLMGMLIGR
ncbi:hypothetical protein A2G06_16725 (plasmid) [Geobacter anodireducens]|nr:hypothetical protein A2G06_16725 [Geobacter anodireducens]